MSARQTVRGSSRWGVAFLVGAVVGTGAWLLGAHVPLGAQARPGQRLPETVVQPAVDLSDAFVKIAAATTPGVVNIESRVPPGTDDDARQRPEVPEEFRRFFDMPDMDPGPRFAGGTGFVVRADGYILTNAHVVSGADQVTVTLHDRRALPAQVVGTDPTTDVAVIKVNATGLPVLPLGNSDAVRVGEWIIAIGNPGFGGGSQLDYTVTAGIVSALGRPLQLLGRGDGARGRFDTGVVGPIENFLQTDAVINPGNSGGPMIDLRGQVIGINSAIASQTGFYQGYGFAVPVNLARRVMEDLIRYGEVRRPVLGVSIATVSPEDAELYRLPQVSGVLVQEVNQNGAAARAGLQQRDVIVAIDGKPVGTVGELQQTIAQHNPGDRVMLRYYREGRPRDVAVTLGQSTISGVARDRAAPPRPESAGTVLGIDVRDMDAALARRLGFERAGGAVIVNVDPAGPSARRGLRPGLRITRVNGEEIDDADEVQDQLDDLEAGSIASLEVEDPSGNRRIVNVRLPQ
jgi:serine protease Do